MKIAINTSGVDYGDMGFSEFEKLGEVVYFKNVPRGELFEIAKDCDAIIINKVIIDEEFLSRCPKIKYIGVFATGYNVVDLDACRAHGVVVCNAPDYSTHAVCQHVFGLLLNFYGRIGEYNASVAAGGWVKSDNFCYYLGTMREIYGKNFGVYGYGNIGKAVAKVAEAFGANVFVCTRTVPENCAYKTVGFEEMLKTCDIISLHCPLTGSTAKMINRSTIALMKRDAVLVNTARGGLVDERALAEALNGGKLGGACLDVVDSEPMAADNPLLGAKNCIITPHSAWLARETRERLFGIVAGNLKAFIEGKPRNVVNNK